MLKKDTKGDKRKGNSSFIDEEARRIVDDDLREIKERNRAPYDLERKMSAEMEGIRHAHSGDQWPNTLITNTESCYACRGTGRRECVQCDGRGWFYNQRLNIRERCPICNESGYVECRSCGGKGYR